MTIDKLSQLLDEIKGYVDDYKVVKNENTRLKEEAVEKDSLIASLQSSIGVKDNKISELETRVAELEKTANLNLAKAQELVNTLKEIANA